MASKRNNQGADGGSGDDEYDSKDWDTDEGEDEQDDQGGDIDEDDAEPSDDDDDADDDDDDGDDEFHDEDDRKKAVVTSYRNHDESSRVSKYSEWGDGRGKLVPILVLICCCCCIIIGVIVGVVVFPLNNNDDSGGPSPSSSGSSPSDGGGAQPITPIAFPTPPPQALTPSSKPPPTDFPTISPAPTGAPIVIPTEKPTEYPTAFPTSSMAPSKSIPETLAIPPDQDTMVYLNGFYIGEAYGSDDTFLVQNGPNGIEEVPDAVSLISFPLTDVPKYDRLTAIKKNAFLRLSHQVTTAERGPATYTLVRLNQTVLAVETFHGYLFRPPDDDSQVVVGPNFTVSPTDTVVNVDITSLLFDHHPEDKQLFLMIQDRGAEQPQGGDRFFSRESTTPPLLLIDFTGGSAADIVTPTQDTNETIAPSSTGSSPIGVADDSGNNTATDPPINNRTVNQTIPDEMAPSMAPSTSLAPSVALNGTSDGNIFNTSDGSLIAATSAPSAAGSVRRAGRRLNGDDDRKG